MDNNSQSVLQCAGSVAAGGIGVEAFGDDFVTVSIDRKEKVITTKDLARLEQQLPVLYRLMTGGGPGFPKEMMDVGDWYKSLCGKPFLLVFDKLLHFLRTDTILAKDGYGDYSENPEDLLNAAKKLQQELMPLAGCDKLDAYVKMLAEKAYNPTRPEQDYECRYDWLPYPSGSYAAADYSRDHPGSILISIPDDDFCRVRCPKSDGEDSEAKKE
jgi:hypothetical protein